jgi:phosphoribosylformylglycinamidine synthase subunit PurS
VRRKYGELMKAKVIVMPKAAVLDPQGNAVRDAMRHLGMPEVRSVRIGKYMEIDVDGENGETESRLHGLCRDLLSNPVIEDYELQRVGSQRTEVRGQKSEMKALRYFFCVVLPPLAVLMTGRIASFLLSILLTLLGWIPGVIHACLVVNDYHAEQRAAAH